MNTTIAALALTLTAATTYAALDAGLLDLTDKAFKRAEQIQRINHEQHLKLARQAYFIDHGRFPANDELLFSEGYLDKPDTLKE